MTQYLMNASEMEKLAALPWTSPVSIQEPVIFFQEGNALAGSLLYLPSEILAIEAWDETTNGFIVLPEDAYSIISTELKENGKGAKIVLESACLPFLKKEDLVQPLGSPMAYPATRDGTNGMLFSENGYFHKTAVLVTYQHDDAWGGWYPRPDSGNLPRTRRVLAEQLTERLDMLVFGDSISTGANCSAQLHLSPGNRSYPDLIAAKIEQERPSLTVRLKNASVGGASSEYGKKHVKDVLAEGNNMSGGAPPFAFDLNIIAWGANDAGGKKSARGYTKNIDMQLKNIVKVHPDAEFILVSSSMMNENWNHGHNDFLVAYQDALQKIAKKWGQKVMFADATQCWKEVLDRKSYLDLTGNGLNHPNDFGHRLYAQVICSLLSLF
jgi:acyl-CoA thioesterase I